MHRPRSQLHIYRGRVATVSTDPIAAITEADVESVTFVVDGLLAVDATFEDTDDGLVVTVTLPEDQTALLPIGTHLWQLLPVDADGNRLEPLAEGRVIVTEPAQPPEESS